MDHVYAECPWVVPPDAPELLTLFREKGRPAFVRSRTVVNFGEEPTAYMVEEGLVGTFAGGVGKYERLIVLFPPGTSVGAEKSIKGKHAIKPLIARALLPTKVLVMDAAQFKRELELDPILCIAALKSFIRHDDAKIEGLLMNDLLTVPQRVALMVKVLFQALNMPLTALPKCLPKTITVTELARLVHSGRAVVSRILAKWVEEGIVVTHDGMYFFSNKLNQVLGDDGI